MLGLIPPSSGKLMLDGKEKSLLYAFRSSSVAYVPQEIFVLAGTVAENVTVGSPQNDVDESFIWKILDDVNLSQKVRARGGLEARIGEAGSNLSGGERQRLGIARALYAKPSLLVLDEATSQLDGDTEDFVLQRIIARGRDITLISVTHRHATLTLFDRVVHLEGGRISIEAAHNDCS
jgi:ABC-type bacteriocin/lantibiotic exporter with double-glycine peptidase domain